MATELAAGYISLIPSTKGIGAAISKEMSAPIEQAAHQTSSNVGGIFKKLAVGVGAAFAVVKGVQVFKGFIDDAEESRRIGKQTEAAIRSTGSAAKVTAKEVGDLATAISNKTGVDDEAIQSGENLLLTFTDIQNRAGKGNDVFNQATATLTDMAAALGGDVSSNAVQLGKALNDPIAGISALSRVGVTFTDQQKNTIKQMVATGNVAGAQKVILAELNKEFGGSAEAQATAGKKLGVIWGNIREQIGGALLPIVDKVAAGLGVVLPRAVDIASSFLHKLHVGVSALVAAFKDPDVTSGGFVGAMERIGVALRHGYDQVRLFVNALRTGFTQDEGTPIERIALIIRDIAIPAFRTAAGFTKDHLTIAVIGLGVAIAFLLGPVTGTIAVLAALAAGAIYAYNHFSGFKTAVDAVAGFFTNILIPALRAGVSYITDQIGHLATWWRTNWEDIKKATETVLKGILLVVALAVAPFVFIWQHAGEQILDILKIAWNQVRLVIETAVRIIRDIVTFFVALLSGDWGKAWNAIKDIPAAILDFVVGTVSHGLEMLWHLAQGALDVLGGIWSAGWNGIKTVATTVLRGVVDFFLGIVEDILNGGAKAFGWVPGIGGKLKEAAKEFAQFRDDVNAALGGIKDKVINVAIRGVERHIDPNIGGSFDDGGVVPGPRGKAQLIVAHGGEVVLSNAMVAGVSSPTAAGIPRTPYSPTYIINGVAGAEDLRRVLDEHDREFLRTIDAA